MNLEIAKFDLAFAYDDDNSGHAPTDEDAQRLLNLKQAMWWNGVYIHDYECWYDKECQWIQIDAPLHLNGLKNDTRIELVFSATENGIYWELELLDASDNCMVEISFDKYVHKDEDVLEQFKMAVRKGQEAALHVAFDKPLPEGVEVHRFERSE